VICGRGSSTELRQLQQSNNKLPATKNSLATGTGNRFSNEQPATSNLVLQ